MWWCMADNPIIALKDLVKTYHLDGVSTRVLKQVSLAIYEGDLLAIVGASGSGKSTLMNIMGLLDKPDTGSYFLRNRDILSYDEDELAEIRNQTIGFVFQQFNLLPRFTALQNVALPLTYRGLSPSDSKERVMLALQRVGMEKYAAHRPTQLSGGQQQRVAIARALVTEPAVILADEPTGALDSRTGSEVMRLFAELNADGRSLVIVTHDEQIARQCKRRITLADGEVVGEISQCL